MGQRLDELLQYCTVKLKVPAKMGWGTGFFVAPRLILTCAHVVRDAETQAVKVFWHNQDDFADGVTEGIVPDPFDLALLRLSSQIADLPCVYLDTEIQPEDRLYIYGYPDDFAQGAPVTGLCEGLTGDRPPLIKFKAGNIRPGLSGSPLLNQRTGKVSGIVKFTRDRSIDLGGGAIPTEVIFSKFPELLEKNRKFHQQNNIWVSLLPSPEIVIDSGERQIVNDSDFEKLEELLKRSGRVGSLSARKALCLQIRVDPNELDFLDTAARDFATQLIYHLRQNDDNEAIVRLCKAIAPILKGKFAADLEAIQSKFK